MSYQFEKVKVLIVEDNEPMLDLATSILLTFGVGEVIPALDGHTGFRRFCQAQPDVVIADWMMSPINGISFTEMIRKDPLSPNKLTPVILMTGFTERERVIHARDAGVTEFLAKPFTARGLYQKLVQIIEKPRQFVRSGVFFGPDRRRKRLPHYSGPFRRGTDVLPEEMDGGDIALEFR